MESRRRVAGFPETLTPIPAPPPRTTINRQSLPLPRLLHHPANDPRPFLFGQCYMAKLCAPLLSHAVACRATVLPRQAPPFWLRLLGPANGKAFQEAGERLPAAVG